MLALQTQIEIEKERRRREAAAIALKSPFRFDPARYFQEKFNWQPWSGSADLPGQQQIIDAYVLALRQQLEKRDYENGLLSESQLEFWQPGTIIKNVLHVEAGHTVGKTKVAAGLLSHFFDHFSPSVIYSFAPSWEQVKKLLWKEVGADRKGRSDLPGKLLENCQLIDPAHPNHFATGKATNNVAGTGTERVQGQHEAFQFYIIDEAEGVADFVFDALEGMTSGGISIVLMLANPRTRISRFHKAQAGSEVKAFRMSCLHHPNVLAGREIVPGAVKRDYVSRMLEKHCDEVDQHEPDDFTFEVPWEPGKIWLPNAEFLFRVLGIPPKNLADRNLIPVGRFEAACKRQPVEDRPDCVWIGVDVARFGSDLGAIYYRWNGGVYFWRKLSKLVTQDYTEAIYQLCEKLHRQGVRRVQIRVDGGGGFGSGIIDNLRIKAEMLEKFEVWNILEVQFGASASDPKQYRNKITELTADAAESLKGLAVISPPNELQADLCERLYKYQNFQGYEVKLLESKDDFKTRLRRSPDDGDAFVLATASDHLIQSPDAQMAGYLYVGKKKGW